MARYSLHAVQQLDADEEEIVCEGDYGDFGDGVVHMVAQIA